jgi:hypothetical protein
LQIGTQIGTKIGKILQIGTQIGTETEILQIGTQIGTKIGKSLQIGTQICADFWKFFADLGTNLCRFLFRIWAHPIPIPAQA